MKEFINNTKGLTKNPLGIIALFISLIYGFASLVLGVSVKNMESNERLILIWFLVIFPVIVLIAFVYLVMYHHKKLYSPADFRDDKSFLETFNKEQKIVSEFEEQKQEQVSKNKNEEKISIATKRKINKPEILEFNDFKAKYLKIENLVIERIKRIYGENIKRNVRIKGLERAEFDGVIINDDEIIFIEIKYTVSNHLNSSIIKRLKTIINQLEDFAQKSYINRKITFYIYIVCETENINSLNAEKETIIKMLHSDLINVKIELIDYKTLENE